MLSLAGLLPRSSLCFQGTEGQAEEFVFPDAVPQGGSPVRGTLATQGLVPSSVGNPPWARHIASFGLRLTFQSSVSRAFLVQESRKAGLEGTKKRGASEG